MIREGILIEIGEQAPTGKVSRGRKKILLDIHSTWRLVLGISLHGGWVDVGLCTLNGSIVEHHTAPLQPDDPPKQLIGAIRSIYGDLAYKNDLKQDSLIGVGVAVDRLFSDLRYRTRQKRTDCFYRAREKTLHVFQLPRSLWRTGRGHLGR